MNNIKNQIKMICQFQELAFELKIENKNSKRVGKKIIKSQYMIDKYCKKGYFYGSAY